MAMLAGLQTEIDKHPDLAGASARIVMEKLNHPGSASTEELVKNENSRRLPKANLLAMLDNGNIQKLIDFMETQPVMKLLFDSASSFDPSHSKFVEMISTLEGASIISADEKTAILRIGERLKSRAEELFGRNITMEDFA